MKSSFALLVLILTICSSALAQEEPSSKGKAIIYVYSPATTTTLGRLKKPIFLDNKEIADIRPERYFIVLVEPGTHTLHLRNKKLGGIEKEFKADTTYYIRIDWKNNGFSISPSGIFEAPPENGSFAIKQLRLIEKENIKDRSMVVLELPK